MWEHAPRPWRTELVSSAKLQNTQETAQKHEARPKGPTDRPFVHSVRGPHPSSLSVYSTVYQCEATEVDTTSVYGYTGTL